MYRLATIHSVANGRTDSGRSDRQTYDANSRSCCVQYDRLKTDKFTAEAKKIIAKLLRKLDFSYVIFVGAVRKFSSG